MNHLKKATITTLEVEHSKLIRKLEGSKICKIVNEYFKGVWNTCIAC